MPCLEIFLIKIFNPLGELLRSSIDSLALINIFSFLNYIKSEAIQAIIQINLVIIHRMHGELNVPLSE